MNNLPRRNRNKMKIVQMKHYRYRIFLKERIKYLVIVWVFWLLLTQPVFTCSKLIIETLEQGVKICSKLTIKKPERRQWSFFSKIVNGFWSSPATLLKKILWHRYFSVNFAKFLRTPFFAENFQATASEHVT